MEGPRKHKIDYDFLEASLRQYWSMFDENNEGAIPFDVFWIKFNLTAVSKGYISSLDDLTPEKKENCRRIVDPLNTGKATLDGFRALMMKGVDKAKRAGEAED